MAAHFGTPKRAFFKLVTFVLMVNEMSLPLYIIMLCACGHVIHIHYSYMHTVNLSLPQQCVPQSMAYFLKNRPSIESIPVGFHSLVI